MATKMGEKVKSTINFGAGPAKLPEEVLVRAQREFLEYGDSGISILEMSHRSPIFDNLLNETKKMLRDEMNIPDEYDVLFVQGGGIGQMAAVPLNIPHKSAVHKADYLVTGKWSETAVKEAVNFLEVNEVIKPKLKAFTHVPDQSEWKVDPDADYLYYCCNETIHGVEMFTTPEANGVPLVTDVSSNIMSRPMDVSKHAVMYAGAQKNVSGAGLTLVIVRRDMLGKPQKHCPSVMNWTKMSKANSLMNTPPVFPIYLTRLVLDWVHSKGGVDGLETLNKQKAANVYGVIDESNGFYSAPVVPEFRSRMNVPFRIFGAGTEPDTNLEAEFLKGAAKRDMIALKGHRDVGGIRASLYNAVTVKETEKLAEYMKEFMTNNQK